MAYEMLVAMWIENDEAYQNYRNAMAPILTGYGGGFGYDFRIAEVLKSQSDHPINRVFTIYFKDEAAKEDFFTNPDYLEIKKRYFEGVVKGTTIIATYRR